MEWGITVDEPRYAEARLAVHSPHDISSASFMPRPSNPCYDYIGGPFIRIADLAISIMASHIGCVHEGGVVRLIDLYSRGLLFRQHFHGRTIIF
eukprot:6214687-Pleurochrysis_carterae.AAC.9